MKLMTSLDEIKSYGPCAPGWADVLKGRSKRKSDSVLFPLSECVESNSIEDVCWLLGKRKIEIQICVSFALKCAKSVEHLRNKHAAYAAAADAAAYAAYAYAAYAAAAYAAAAYAAAYAAAAAAYADDDDADAQKAKNKQFLLDAIAEWENSHV